MRRTLIIFALGLALLIGDGVVLLFFSPASVTVRNDSKQTLTEISVMETEKGHKLAFPDLPPGHSARRWFHNTGTDGGYYLVARRSNGTQLHAGKGYTPGRHFYRSAQFTFNPSGTLTISREDR